MPSKENLAKQIFWKEHRARAIALWEENAQKKRECLPYKTVGQLADIFGCSKAALYEAIRGRSSERFSRGRAPKKPLPPTQAKLANCRKLTDPELEEFKKVWMEEYNKKKASEPYLNTETIGKKFGYGRQPASKLAKRLGLPSMGNGRSGPAERWGLKKPCPPGREPREPPPPPKPIREIPPPKPPSLTCTFVVGKYTPPLARAPCKVLCSLPTFKGNLCEEHWKKTYPDLAALLNKKPNSERPTL